MIDIGRLVRDCPSEPSVVDRSLAWSWAELEARVASVAAGLAAAGRVVALSVPLSADSIIAIHAAARAGIDVLLVNPRLTEPEIAGLGASAGAGDPIDPADLPMGDASGAALGVRRATTFLIATSGSTARPKLAELPVDRLAASASAWNAVLPPATGWLLSLGLDHVAGLGIVVRAALAGVPVVVPDRTGAPDLLEAMRRAPARGVTVSHLSLVAAQLAALAVAAPPEGVRAVLVGGGPVPGALVTRARAAGWPVIVTYGSTETASGVVADGRPLPGAELRTGNRGEIAVRGPMVFAGYRGDADATRAALDGDGWYRTGDLGRLGPDGRLVIDGRADDLIIRGGENVSPAEVEAALLSHPAVAEAAVVGRPDPVLGWVPVAAIVLRAGADGVDDDALRAHVRARLAGFKVPDRFVRMPALPRTTLGKVARSELERLIDDGDRRHAVPADDGVILAVVESGPPDGTPVVLLHATMASSAHLTGLARLLERDARVVRIDRRGSGASLLEAPAAVPVERHVRDVVAVLDALGIERAALFGHSFGGVVAIETARRFPSRVRAVAAWEPPYVPVAPQPWRDILTRVGEAVEAGFAADGPGGAARGFIESVGGPEAWAAIPERQRAAMGRAGTGALADAAMVGLTGEGLQSVVAPTLILTGDASEPFYRPTADALAARIGAAATRGEIAGGLDHMAPGHSPAPIAAAVRHHLDLPTLDEEIAP